MRADPSSKQDSGADHRGWHISAKRFIVVQEYILPSDLEILPDRVTHL